MTRALQHLGHEEGRLVQPRVASAQPSLASVTWLSAVGNQGVQRIAISAARASVGKSPLLQRKWAYGYTATGQAVVKWVTTRAGEPEEAPDPPIGWSRFQVTDQVGTWYMEMPQLHAPTFSVYDRSQQLDVKGSQNARMAVVLVVDNAYVGGHSYIAFEWFEQVADRQEIVRRHKVFHLEGKERRNTPWERALRAIGYGSAPGQFAQITARDATMSVTELDSDPQYFYERATRSYYLPWFVDYERGLGAYNYARSRLGNVPFSLIPMYPSTYNCAQLAGEIASRAGVPAFSYIGQVLPSWAVYLQHNAQPVGRERRAVGGPDRTAQASPPPM